MAQPTSKLSSKLSNLKSQKKLKPTMRINFSSPSQFDDSDYDKKEMDDLDEQIKALEKHKTSLTPEKAHKHMQSALEAELLQKKGRQMQLKGRVGGKC